VQLGRRTLAQRALEQVVAAIGDVIGFHCQETGQRRVAAAGEWFSVPAVNSRLQKTLGTECSIAPVSGPEALALGAALPHAGPRAALAHLAFGANPSDDGIKQTLDNCRVDYVYEPSMERLLLRSAALLAGGKQVGWCQGPADIGGRSLGSRSVLTDPGNRYARENLNVFLLERRPDRPLMLSIQEERCGEVLEQPSNRSRFGEWQGTVRREHRQALGAAVDAEGRCALHTVSPASPAHLWQLLDACSRHHGMPGLLNVPLGRGDGTLAASPREAIQAFYSSAVDALVVGRFLLMKDYWLLRSDLG
jgi:carbamoyltransferase